MLNYADFGRIASAVMQCPDVTNLKFYILRTSYETVVMQCCRTNQAGNETGVAEKEFQTALRERKL